MPRNLDPAVNDLVHYTRSRVSDEDIRRCSPGDPGWPNYVKLWTGIRQTGIIPRETNFDFREVIAMTSLANAEQARDPARFRGFRRFTSAVALALLHYGNDMWGIGSFLDTGDLAHDLLIDLDPRSKKHLPLLRSATESTRELLRTTYPDAGYPFFTFAAMILAQKAGDWNAAEAGSRCPGWK